MIRTDILRGEIVKKGLSQAKMAEIIGITPKTFYEKMKKGVFGSDEIQIMIETLEIKDPMDIFFCRESILISYQRKETRRKWKKVQRNLTGKKESG